MNGHLTSITLNTGDTLWTLRKQNPRLLPTRIGLGGLDISLSEPPSIPPKGGKPRVATRVSPPLQGGLRGALTNILSHSTAGQYGYGTAKPYAFNELLTASALIPAREQHISFNAMQQPDTISEGGYTATFSYYGDMGRASMTLTDSLGGTETRVYYDQQYNEFTRINGNTTQTKRILWVGGTAYNAPAALVKDYVESDWQLVRMLRDNLGSITHVVDTAGTVLQEMSYSAWGLLRDPATLEPYGPDAQPELLLGRGYTGHEHLPWFGLLNMNARLYEPAVGRFLSPDPMVQAPDNTQNYNRYSYCLNNPMKYVDILGLARSEYYFDPDENGEDIFWHYIPDIEIEIVADAPITSGSGTNDMVWYFHSDFYPIWTPNWNSNPYIGIYEDGGSSSGMSSRVQLSSELNVPQPTAHPTPPNWSRIVSITSLELSFVSEYMNNNGFISYGWDKYNIPQLRFARVKRRNIHGFKAYSVENLVKHLNYTTVGLGILNSFYDGYMSHKALQNGDYDAYLRYGVDALVDGITAVPCKEALIANLAWNLGGREIFWQLVYFNHEYIIMPEYYNGTLGRLDTMPFK